MQRRTLLQSTLAASALLLGTSLSPHRPGRGNWPTGKPITYLVPFPPAAIPTPWRA
jgi:hypothetical protein